MYPVNVHFRHSETPKQLVLLLVMTRNRKFMFCGPRCYYQQRILHPRHVAMMGSDRELTLMKDETLARN